MGNENKDVVYLDIEGKNKLLQEIEELKNKLNKNKLDIGDAYSGAVGDGWHDNFAFDEANRQDQMLLGRLNQCYELLSRVVIVDKLADKEIIDLNDIVKVDLFLSSDKKMSLSFRLVSLAEGESKDGIKEISINSPLGKAVYHKHVDDVVSYEADGRKIEVKIILKQDNKAYTKKLKLD